MALLLNIIGFLIAMIVCPIVMIPWLLWRLVLHFMEKEITIQNEPAEQLSPLSY